MKSPEERCLAHAEAIRLTMRQIQFDLSASLEVVREELAWLREQVTSGMPLTVDDPTRDVRTPPTQPVVSASDEIHMPPLPPGQPAEKTDRRTRPRRRGNPVSILAALNEDVTEPVHGWVIDRHPDGIGLIMDEAVPVGTVMSVRPTSPPPASAALCRWIQVTVRHCRKERNSYSVGCQFMQTLSWEDMQLFG